MSALPTQAPFSQEAEEAVLGAILINPDSYLTIASFLTTDDFFILRHRHIWDALTRISQRNEKPDFVTVQDELRAMGQLTEIGGPAFILNLINNTPTSIHAEVYAHLVERASTRRKLLTAADQIKGLALDETLNLERVVSEAETRLFGVTETTVRRDVQPIGTAINEYFERVELLMQSPEAMQGLPTGFRDLDQLLGGLQRSDLLIFAGRPGMGKTSFLLSVALNAAKVDARIAIFTMEMGADQIVQRFMAMETGINTQKLRTGHLSQQEYSKFVHSAGNLGGLPIFIDDTPSMSPVQMRTKCRRIQHEFGLDLVIVDYLQLMSGGGTFENNRVQEISFISRNLKEMARELQVPVFSAAQLSRAVEQRQDKHPQLSDLRESGCLAGESLVYLPDMGDYVPIRELQGKSGFRVMSLNQDTWRLEPAEVSQAWCTGTKPVFMLTTQLGRSIRATGNHKFLTINGWTRLDELTTDDRIAVPAMEANKTTSRQTQAELGNAYCGTGLYKQNISRERGLRLSHVVQSEAIGKLAQSDVYWDAIVSIEPDGECEVFDLTVPQNSCFVAENLIAHNSLEQDADIVAFLYREVVYNEAAENPNKAEVIIAKHRNGPTGSISLHYENQLTKFLDARPHKIDLSGY